MDRRRRGCLIVLAVLVTALGVTWWLLPRLVCALANASLPREFGPEVVLIALSPDCRGLQTPAIHLQATPAQIRHVAAEATRRWIPPGIVREGFGAIGALRGDGGLSVAWRAEAAAIDPPRLDITLTPAEADALIAASGGSMRIAGMELTPHLASAEIAEVAGPGGQRRFRVEASGSLQLRGGSIAVAVPVRRLVGTIDLTFTADSGGWEPALSLSIDELDAPLPGLPGVDASAWRILIAEAIERRLADRLSGRNLPSWFPLDLRVAAIVR